MERAVCRLEVRLIHEIEQGFRVSACDGCLNHNKLSGGVTVSTCIIHEVSAAIATSLFSAQDTAASPTRRRLQSAQRHCALTVSRPCTNMTLLLRRVAHLIILRAVALA
jgi:hypothetical protein